MGYPPHLLDELARVFARVALDRLLKESAARQPRQEGGADDSKLDVPVSGNGEMDNDGRER